MKNKYKFFKKTFLTLVVLFLCIWNNDSFAQLSYVTTVPPYNGGNSSALSAFNIKANVKIRIKEVYISFSSISTQSAIIWYKTDSINTISANSISTSNGWIQAASITVTPTASGAGNITLIPAPNLSIEIPAGATYGFAVSSTGITYTGSGSTPVSPWVIGNSDLYINMGTAVGYGGTIASPIQYRQFNGKIGYEIVSMGPNNAGISSLASPINFCSGTQQIKVKVANKGSNRIDSVRVNWKLDGVTQPTIFWNSIIDTANGLLPSDTILTLGSTTFTSGTPKTLKAWTSMPNGVADTSNQDDTINVILRPALNGTYTIGGTSPDFTTIGNAVSALTSAGVCGPVIFNIASGTYTGQITLSQIAGASSFNTITFQSATGDSTAVILTNSSTTLNLNGTDYVTFKKLTIKTTSTTSSTYAVNITGGANYNIITNCVIDMPVATTTIYGINDASGLDNYNTYSYNLIKGGYYGMYVYGASTTSWQKGTVIVGNEIKNFYLYGMYLYYNDSIQVINNNIHDGSGNTYYYGILCYYVNNSYRIIGNKVSLTATSTTASNGIREYYGNYVSYNASPTGYGVVANNFITIGGGTAAHYGLYAYYSNGTGYYYNSINILTSSTTSSALYQTNTSTNTLGQTFKNNIFSNKAGGYAAYFATTAQVAASDFNDFHTTGTNLAYWGANVTSLSALQTASGKDINSKNVDPLFISTTNLHIMNPNLDGKGTPVSGISYDIDNQFRNPTTPDIGADEFSLLANDAGISAFVNPSDTICSGSKPVNVTLKNFGPSTLNSVKINWKINGVNQTIYNWTGNLLPQSTANVNIGSYNFLAGTAYTLIVATSNPNGSSDSIGANDTLVKSNIYVKLTPTATPTSGTLSLCFGDSILIGGTLSGSAPWNMVITVGTTTIPFTNILTPVFGMKVSPSTTTTYSVTTLSDITGCINSIAVPVVVTVNPLPAANTGGAKSYCFGNSTSLGAATVSGNTYLWTPSTGLNNATVSNPIATPTVTTTYTLLETKTSTGCFKKDSMIVTVNPIPVVNAGPNQTISTNNTVTMNGSATNGVGTFNYLWKPTNLFANPALANAVSNVLNFSTIFTLIVTDMPSGCKDSATMAVSIIGGPLYSQLSTSKTALCNGDSSQLQALASGGTGNYTYSWTSSPTGFTSGVINPKVFPTVTTKYYLNIYDGTNNKLDSITVTVYNNPPAVITPAGTTTFCQGQSVVLNASTGVGYTYKWYKDNVVISGATASSFTASTAGAYKVWIKDVNNCTTTSVDSLVTVNPNPTASFTLTGNTSFCIGDSILCTANTATGLTYQWKLNNVAIPGATAQTFYAKQSGALLVSVTNSFNCSTNSSATTLNTVTYPSASILPAGSTIFCPGGSVILNANTGTGLTYKWYKDGVLITAATAATYSATLAGVYTVQVTNSTGCATLSATGVTVSLINAPTAFVTASGSTSFCSGDSVVLSANTGAGLTYQWKKNTNDIIGATGTTFAAKTTGTYTVSVSNGACATLSNSIVVTTITNPPAIVVPSGTVTFCSGDSMQLSTSNGSGYTHQWFKNSVAITGATTATFYAKTAGTYYVVITASGVCTATSPQVIVNITPPPAATLTPAGPVVLCQNDSVILTAATGTNYTYFWKKDGASLVGASGNVVVVKQSGNYMVIVSDGNCSDTSNIVNVSFTALPNASITYTGSLSFCPYDSVILKANTAPNYTYQWNLNGTPIPGKTDSVLTVKTVGTYSVKTSVGSCSSTSSGVATTHKTLPVINLGHDTTICSYKTISLNAGTGMTSYLWSTGALTQTITVDSVGAGFGSKTISVVVAKNGCLNADTIVVTFANCYSINENLKSSLISIFPNPSKGLFKVEFEGENGNYELKVFDLTGKVIYQETFTVNSYKSSRLIDLTSQPKGIYLIKVNNDKFMMVKKVVVE